MLLAAVVFFALALGTGSTETSLLILGPISTFALPAVAMIAFWWNDWPGSSLTTPWTGLIDTVLVVIAAVGADDRGPGHRRAIRLTRSVRGQPRTRCPHDVPRHTGARRCGVHRHAAVVAGLRALAAGRPRAAAFRRRRTGALLGCRVGAYFLFVNLDAVPSAERAAAGLRNPGGPVPAADFGAALIAVGVWQAVFFIALRGWPVNTIDSRPRRLLAGNALVIGLGALTYLVLRNLARWQPGAISAVCGCVISAALIVAMLFEGWPAARLAAAPGRALTARPHRPGGAGAQPRPGRLRRQCPLDKGHPRRLGHHRRAQLHRRRHHPARRHRPALAVRRPGQGVSRGRRRCAGRTRRR